MVYISAKSEVYVVEEKSISTIALHQRPGVLGLDRRPN